MSSTSEDARFLREGVIEVDAAMVGIGRDRWVSIDAAEATDERAAEIMRANRFDILPISSSGGVREYYGAKTWNDHSVIGKEALTHKDVVPLDTSIRDVIRGFATEGRLFYFLNDESRIVGLVSVANLNARQVKLYLFGAISELEVRLGALISARVNEADLVAMTFGGTDKEKYDEVKKRYETDRANGVEVDFVEYLYLADLMRIAVAKGLHKVLGYSKTQFEKNFGSINDLRHRVAHPARSLVTGDHRVERLWKRIDRIEEALFALRLVDKACLVLCDLPVQYRVENFKKENLDLMRDRWEAITGAIERGVNLVNTFGIDRDTLTSANALIPIIYYLYQHPKVTLLGSTPFEARNAMAIRCWLTMALLNNVFGGQSDRTLTEVRAVLQEQGDASFDFPVVALNRRLARSGKTAEATDAAIDDILDLTYGTREAYLALSLLYDMDHWGGSVLHMDHIVAQKLFRRMDGDAERIARYQGLMNRLGNLELLTAHENLEKSGQDAQTWLEGRDSDFKRRHLIPDDPQLLHFDRFDGFVTAREALIRQRLRALFAPLMQSTMGETVAS